jgi:hypothetical protein
MSNINGKVYAMNAITPMKPWKTWILRAIFFVLGHVKPLQKDLIDLRARPRWVNAMFVVLCGLAPSQRWPVVSSCRVLLPWE